MTASEILTAIELLQIERDYAQGSPERQDALTEAIDRLLKLLSA